MLTVLLCLCEEAVQMLRADVRARGMPKRGGTYTTFDGKGGSGTSVRIYPDHFGLLQRNRDSFQKLLHWEKCAAVWSSNIAKRRQTTVSADLEGMIFDIVQQCGLRPGTSRLSRIVASHFAMWKTDRFESVRELALIGLLPGVKRCLLGDHAELRLLSPSRLNRFWNEDAASFSLYGPGTAQYQVLDAKYLLVIRVQFTHRDRSLMFVQSLRRAEQALAAIRLAIVGCVGVAATRERFVPKPYFVSGSSVQDPPPSLASSTAAPHVAFDADAARRASLIFRQLLNGVPNGFALAIRRFSQSFGRHTPEDAIIDLAIALEATLLHGQNTELSYRIQLLGAALLRRTAKQAANALKDLYSVRSKIVHGAKTLHELKGTMTDAFVNEMRLLVAELLREYLSLLAIHKSMNGVCRALEGQVLASVSTSRHLA